MSLKEMPRTKKMTPTDDSCARRAAISAEGSYIVQAPAGSGKTELLIQRYMNLLSHVEAPEEVIAITFTRKAANEMRDRVLRSLKQANDDRPEADHEALTWDLALAVVKKSRDLDWRLEENPARLRIFTIDALCRSLAEKMPVTSSFGKAPAIEHRPHYLYEEAARRTIAQLEGDNYLADQVRRLLIHLDNDFGKIQRLLVQMLGCRDQWLRVVGGGGNPADLRQVLEKSLDNVVCDGLQTVIDALPEHLQEDLVDLARHAAENHPHGSEALVAACSNLDRLPGAEAHELEVWRGLADLLLTKSDTWRKSVTKNHGFPKHFRGHKERMVELLSAVEHDDYLRERFAEIKKLPLPAYSDEQWAIMEAMIAVLRLAAAQLKLTFQAHGVADFAEIALRALDALGTEDDPTDLALALDYRISHILVDEFQDTSFTQYELLKRLTAGWEPGDGRTLFVVGDPMQSIYRFREADVGLFLKAQQHGIGSISLEPLYLTSNFRSQAGIVDWVNATFTGIFPLEADIPTGAVTYNPSRPTRAEVDGTPINIHALGLLDDERTEARRVVSICKDETEKGRKVTILVRARAHAAHIISEMRLTGIPFQAVEIQRLAERPVIQDLMSLTRALLHPADRVAWLAALRAPWCGLGLADLLTLAGEVNSLRSAADTIWQCLADEARLARLSDVGRKQIERFTDVAGKALAETGRRPLRQWIEGTWIALGGPACLASAADLDDAMTYLNLLEEIESEGGLRDPLEIQNRVQDLFAAPDPAADDRIQIMTIHKSKGLQFDTVIVPALGKKSRNSESPILLWAERHLPGGDVPELLLGALPSDGRDDPIYEHLRHFERTKEEYELQRLLYVAMTRARFNIHLLSLPPKKRGNSSEMAEPVRGTLLYLLWHIFAEHFGQVAAPEEKPGIVDPKKAAGAKGAIYRLPSAWRLPGVEDVRWGHSRAIAIDDEEFPDFFWAGETARHVGTMVHRILLQIADSGPDALNPDHITGRRPVIAAALRRAGVTRSDLRDAVEKVIQAVLRTVAGQRGQWILSKDHLEARNEYPLNAILNGKLYSVTIDRTFVDRSGTRWIIDYKTGTHAGADLENFLDQEQMRYQNQLERYAAILRKMEKRPIKLGLYFPLIDGGWREWTFA